MKVELGATDHYVQIDQSDPMGGPTNLEPEDARELAENLNDLADQVE